MSDPSACDGHAIPVRLGYSRYYYICACDYRTPTVNDKASALQALQQHQRGSSQNS